MPSAEIVALRTLPALTSDPLVGTERLLADTGSSDGLVTVDQIGLRARQGVTDLVAALAAKADAGDLPENLALDTLTLTKRDTAPAAPGAGKGRLWLAPGSADNKWDLKIITGVYGGITTIKADIDVILYAWDPWWTGPLCADGQHFGSGGYTDALGLGNAAAAFRVSITGGQWVLAGGGDIPVDPGVVLEVKQPDDSWLAVTEVIALSHVSERLITTFGGDTIGLFRLSITPTCLAPTPAPVVTIDWGTSG